MPKPSSDNASVEEAAVTDTSETGEVEELPRLGTQNWRAVSALAFASLGAVFGDLGTSPLYVLNSINYKSMPPEKEELLGGLSVIFWLFTLIVVIKYIGIVLFVGPYQGEGGQIAIYCKIATRMKFIKGPKTTVEYDDLNLLSRAETNASYLSETSDQGIVDKIKHHPVVVRVLQVLVLLLCFIGCSLVISDGLLTPTTSVLSAIGGIEVAVPSFSSVLPVAEVVLIALFLIQRFGSNRISFVFAPVIVIWLLGLLLVGIYNIATFEPGIFKALSPHYAINLLRSNGIDVVSGGMLAITGTEAMFADIGHFGRLPIQLALVCFVYPCLMINYLGQGAYCLHNPAAITNPFFISLPGGDSGGVFWVMFVLATLATIIASQALILSVFSILGQLINIDCFPNLKIIHTSKSYIGKVYIPTVNWLLMIGVVATTAGFQVSSRVTAAYGLGISLDFVVTSVLIFLCMLYVYNWNIMVCLLFLCVFVPLEMTLVIANLKKVPHGAWFTLMVMAIVFTFLSLWRWCSSRVARYQRSSRVALTQVYPRLLQPEVLDLQPSKLDKDDEQSIKSEEEQDYSVEDSEDITENRPRETEPLLSAANRTYDTPPLEVSSHFGRHSLATYPGIAFMYNDQPQFNLESPNTLPRVYVDLVKSFSSLPSKFVFCVPRVLGIPEIPDEERILVAPAKIPGHYKCVVRFGFMQDVRINQALLGRIIRSLPDAGCEGNYSAETVPVLHIFENNLVKCRSPRYSRNPAKAVAHYLRRAAIETFFYPIASVTSASGDLVEVTDEEELDKKIFVGEVIRV
ncbi:high affinity potassium transporter [Diutina catenulata]